MIRGPVLPQSRESLWALVANHLAAIENGLSLVTTDLDCSDGQFGPIDGLARDAGGAPVLVLLAVEGDVLLPARALAALAFLDRVGEALAGAVPEGCFRAEAAGRVIVVGAHHGVAALEALARLAPAGLQLCRLEPFRISGMERFAVRWLAPGAVDTGAGGASPRSADFLVGADQQPLWESIKRLCQRLDAAVRVDGDRFARRITWQGRLLAQVASVDGLLFEVAADGSRRGLITAGDVRGFGDRLVRRYAHLAGLAVERPAADPLPGRDGPDPANARTTGRGTGGDTLRSSLVAARLSPEEYSALGGPARTGAASAEAADDVARIVAAQESSWSGPPPRSD